MKRINITQAAAVIGVAGLLGVASLAFAGDQKSNVTDPAKLPKFANVTVVTATPAERAAAAKVKPSVGQRAAVDANGQLRPVTSAEAASLSATQVQAAEPDAGTTKMANGPEPATIEVNGMIGITAGDDSMSYAVASRGSDGKVRQACVEDVANSEEALKKAKALTGVNKNEK